MRKRHIGPALSAATVGIMAATLTAGKLALSFIPNVEIVTLFIALYSYCFGALGLLASFVFVITETLIYGFGGWVVSYLIYWPLVSAVFMLLGFLRVKGRVIPTALAVIMTSLFGVLTSLVEIGLFSGFFDNFFYRFSVYYLRGVSFYAVHAVSNFLIFILLFSPLRAMLLRVKGRLYRERGGRAEKKFLTSGRVCGKINIIFSEVVPFWRKGRELKRTFILQFLRAFFFS